MAAAKAVAACGNSRGTREGDSCSPFRNCKLLEEVVAEFSGEEFLAKEALGDVSL